MDSLGCCMSIFRINPLFTQKDFNDQMRISPNPRIYYPTAQNNSKRIISFIRSQTNKMLLTLYTKNNIISNKTYHIDKQYSDTIKIVIYTSPLDLDCGGLAVMYNLAKTINDLNISNIKVYIYTYDHITHENDFCNNFFNPFLVDDNTIVIYPEVIAGNPLNAKHVVRWILLDLGLEVDKDYYKMWNKNDLVYHWEPTSLPYSKQLVNIWLNPEIKKYNTTQPRISKCYGYKKLNNIKIHNNVTTFHNEKNDINIDSLPIKEIIKIFNDSSIFYCYDPNTFYSIMATLCGCVTVLHPLDNISKTDYFKSRITCHTSGFCYNAGLAYGNSDAEIKLATSTVNNAQYQFDKLVELWKSTVGDFLNDITQIITNKDELSNTVNNIYYGNDD